MKTKPRIGVMRILSKFVILHFKKGRGTYIVSLRWLPSRVFKINLENNSKAIQKVIPWNAFMPNNAEECYIHTCMFFQG
jgi:hypothetical protein